jgi:hypothetical protein
MAFTVLLLLLLITSSEAEMLLVKEIEMLEKAAKLTQYETRVDLLKEIESFKAVYNDLHVLDIFSKFYCLTVTAIKGINKSFHPVEKFKFLAISLSPLTFFLGLCCLFSLLPLLALRIFFRKGTGREIKCVFLLAVSFFALNFTQKLLK